MRPRGSGRRYIDADFLVRMDLVSQRCNVCTLSKLLLVVVGSGACRLSQFCSDQMVIAKSAMK